MRQPAALRALLVLACTCGLLSAGGPSTARADGELEVSIQTVEDSREQVTAVFTVLGPDKRPIAGLRPDQVVVTDTGQPGSISTLERATDANMGISVVLAIQTSASMAPNLTNVRTAAKTLVESLSPADRAAVVAFSNEVRIEQAMTADKGALNAALDRLQPAGNPAIYDAVIAAVDEAARATTPRKLVILLTDAGGVGQISKASREQALERARLSGVSVNALGFGSVVDLQFLADLATATQGRVLTAPTAADVARAYGEFSDALRSQYVVRYRPGNVANPDRTLRIQVRTAQGTGEGQRGFRAVAEVATSSPTIVATAERTEPQQREGEGSPLPLVVLGSMGLLLLATGGFVGARAVRSRMQGPAVSRGTRDRRPIPTQTAELPARTRRRAVITLLGQPESGRVFEVAGDVATIGADPRCTLHLEDRALRPEQARIFWRDGALMLHDFGPKETRGQDRWERIGSDDEFTVAAYRFRVLVPEESPEELAN